MAAVGSSNISFSGLRTAWGSASYAGGSDPGATNISISEFVEQLSLIQQRFQQDQLLYQLARIFVTKPLVLVVVVDEVVEEDSSTF